MRHHGPTGIDKPDGAVASGQVPTCRYVGDDTHVCANSHGAPLSEHQVCFAEASAQLADLLAGRLAADADLARQDAMAAASDAQECAADHWMDELA